MSIRMKKMLFILPLFYLAHGSAQSKRPVVGATAGIEWQLLGIQPLDASEPDNAAVRSGQPAMGTRVGGFVRWALRPAIDLRSELALSWVQNRVAFRANGQQTYRFVDIDLPLHLVMTNRRKGFPLQGSFLFGGRLGYNIAPQPVDNLKFMRIRAGFDIGLGVEIKTGNWRLQPEFVYSHCLNNLHDFHNTAYDWQVGRVVRDRFAVRLLFWKHK